MTQRGSDLYENYSDSQKYIEKGLITEEENTYLKVALFYKMKYFINNNNIFLVAGDRRLQ